MWKRNYCEETIHWRDEEDQQGGEENEKKEANKYLNNVGREEEASDSEKPGR